MDNNPIGVVINEESAVTVEFKVNGEDKCGFLEAEGILQDASVNRNRRRYPIEELRRAYTSPRVRELVETGNFKGEAGHPTDQSLARQSKIDPRYEQVWYKKIWLDGNYVKGVFSGTSNDLGRSFNEDLRRGQRPSFSLRAIGQLTNEGGIAVINHLTVIGVDRVYYPSHSCAYTTKILTTESEGSKTIPVQEQKLSISPEQVKRLTEAGNCLDGSPIVIPLTQSEIANYIVQESANVQTALNTFDVLYESIELNPSLNTVKMVTRYGDTFHICLEDAVKKELVTGIAKFF